MTLVITPYELKVIVAEHVSKTIPSSHGYPMVVKLIEVYSDGSGKGEIGNLTQVEVTFGKEAQSQLMEKQLKPIPNRPQHIDCPCWATGRYVWVEGCESHPRESAT